MKGLFLFFCLLIGNQQMAQSRADSLELIRNFSKWIDIKITQPEADSMLGTMRQRKAQFEKLHSLPITNDLPYPFAFQSAAPRIDFTEIGNSWEIPTDIVLPARKEDLAFFTILQLASLIRNKKISSLELTQFFLARLRKYDDTLKAVISFTDEIAIKEARLADQEIAAGRYRGPLHGIPYGLKDLFAVEGTSTTWGTEAYRHQQLNGNSFVYKKMREAGAVLCAKLSLGALAFNDLWFGGRTNNPWNLNQGSSGSSAGSAAATAAGLLPFAIGTETYGSIISPSDRCGTTGLRPSFGSISRSGAMVLSWSLDKIGPICRSAEDAAIVFDAVRGSDEADISSLERPFNYSPAQNWKNFKIALAANYFQTLPKESPQWQFIETLRVAGAKIEEIHFPDSIYRANLMGTIIGAESAAAFDELTRTDRDELIERQDKDFWPNSFRAARFIPAVEYINANRHRYTMMHQLNDFISNYDLIIVPTFAGNQLAMTNLSGHPALCLPVGMNKNNSPTSITLLGNYYEEAKLLQVAAAFQKITDYHLKKPPLFIQ